MVSYEVYKVYTIGESAYNLLWHAMATRYHATGDYGVDNEHVITLCSYIAKPFFLMYMKSHQVDELPMTTSQ